MPFKFIANPSQLHFGFLAVRHFAIASLQEAKRNCNILGSASHEYL